MKGTPGARIEKSLQNILPPGAFGCVQSNAWTDEEVMRLWFEQVWYPWIQNEEKSVLLLDAFKYHFQGSFKFI